MMFLTEDSADPVNVNPYLCWCAISHLLQGVFGYNFCFTALESVNDLAERIKLAFEVRSITSGPCRETTRP